MEFYPEIWRYGGMLILTALALYYTSKIIFAAYFNAKLDYAERLTERIKEAGYGKKI